MISNILKLLTFIVFFFENPVLAQEIWTENFAIPEKGIWGDEDGVTINNDFSGISSWTLEYLDVELFNPNDYAKTVTTSGGRFEVCDINGEVSWRSEWIDISEFTMVNIQLTAHETGSSTNSEAKYLKAFYSLNHEKLLPFEINGNNSGNWGSVVAEQKALTGQSLQIIVFIKNSYSSNKVTFDEVVVKAENNESESPIITSVDVLAADTLQILFNKPISENCKVTANFTLQSENNEPIEIRDIKKLNESTNSLIAVIQPHPFPNVVLTAKNLTDLEGNTTAANSFSFEYFPPVHLYDLVINELMADPNPTVGLPESEYIELLNTQNFPVNIENWTLKINNVEKKLQKNVILPGEYLVLCSTGSLEKLQSFCTVSNVVGFQGLTNCGALLEIRDEQKKLIDHILYSDDWYDNKEKDKGGWSLERIDPLRHCNQNENWMVSINSLGGTPGTQNSVFAENQDITSPGINWVVAVSENKIEISFTEKLDTVLLKTTENYFLNELGNPVSILLNSEKSVTIEFRKAFQKNKNYTLEIKNLVDECGNILLQNSFEIQWNTIEPGDVVLNEILFNPFPEGDDFVEIYNNSEKQISLNRLFIATRDEALQLKQIYQLTEKKQQLFPEDYLVLTKDTNGVFPWFSIYFTDCFLTMEKLPGFSNDQGYVVLLNEEMLVIDELFYSSKMHSEILADEEGISLERISFSANTNNINNWHSASSQSGYGTPGYKNSQIANQNLNETEITFSPESFSPNLDGYNDEYKISYHLNKSGCMANAWIFDSAGRFVMQLAKNELLGTNGTITWDGKNETGQRQSIGVYVVALEIFDTEGNILHYKDGVVLTDILE